MVVLTWRAGSSQPMNIGGIGDTGVPSWFAGVNNNQVIVCQPRAAPLSVMHYSAAMARNGHSSWRG